MPTKITLFVATVLLVIFSSCHKSGKSSGSSTPLDGTWTFGSYSANTTVTATNALGTVTIVSDFKTIDNVGSITFAGDSMTANGLGYTIDTTATIYTNSILGKDTSVQAISDAVPATTLSMNYQLVGTDSVYFPEGSFFAVSVGLNTGETIMINGAHFQISNNVLTLTSTTLQADTINYDGQSIPAVTQVQSTVVMTKQ